MKKTILLSVITSLLITTIQCTEDDTMLQFPVDFKFGVSSSSYQTEGAWNVSDKGLSVWDVFTHEIPSRIIDSSNGDIACDSYHKYKEDVALMKELGVNFYRFSISWPRILPTGYSNKISNDGIKYYNNLIDDLITLGIEPWITLYHFDHPAVFEDMGGWTNEMMVTWFADYARVIFREFGDRVTFFVTINEPTIICTEGYSLGNAAPGKKTPSHAHYLCVHNMLKAHAKAYHIYDTEFRKIQHGQIGIALVCDDFIPKNRNDPKTSDIRYAFTCGWAADPIYSKKGDYPDVMKKRIAENSKLEGYVKSKLPEFTEMEIDEIRGSADYLGLNHYSSVMTESAPKSTKTLWYQDSGVMASKNSSWPKAASSWLSVVPQGFGNVLRQFNKLYDNPIIYILENGYSDDGSINDYRRIKYFHEYIRELLIAVNRDGCNVRGYSAWSFMDNFEWGSGYTEHFGLISVNFNDQFRKRTPKLSFMWYQELIKSRKIPAIIKPNVIPINSCACVFERILYLQIMLSFYVIAIY